MAKKKKKEDIHQLTDKELASELHDAQEKLFKMRYSHAAVPVKNPLEIRLLRRRVAQLLTISRLRQSKGL